jgi:hypothetical protein
MKTETIIFDTVTPHPARVNIAELLTDIEAVITRHVVLSDHAAAALAVWVLHNYTFELRDTVAYVAIESPEKRCGKTTLLSVLAAMACKSLIASNITVGALFRAIHTCTPTLFIDEADTFLAGNSIMRGIINSGNTRRTAYVLRLAAAKKGSGNQKRQDGRDAARPYHVASSVPGGNAPLEQGDVTQPGIERLSPHQSMQDGRDAAHACGAALPRLADSVPGGNATPGQGAVTQERLAGTLAPPDLPPESSDTGLKKYSCWCPKVIAMIGEVPDTIADRSIVVKMARKLTTETCAPLAALDTAHIRAKCARFALDAQLAIAQHPKISGEGLNDRATDTFDPLFVIARMAGDEWEQKLRAAALGLCSSADTENSGSGLILDIVDVFFQTGSEKMFSRDIIARLREGSMNSQSLNYSSINEYHISKILRHYRIRPTTLRVGKQVSTGYIASDFREALERYVSEEDIRKHVEDLRRRCQLREEARAEAAQQEALIDKVVAAIPKGKFLTQREIEELALKLKKEQDMAISSQPNQDNVNVAT